MGELFASLRAPAAAAAVRVESERHQARQVAVKVQQPTVGQQFDDATIRRRGAEEEGAPGEEGEEGEEGGRWA